MYCHRSSPTALPISLIGCVCLLAMLAELPTLRAQTAAGGDDVKVEAPQTLAMTTKDDVKIVATYYPGTQEKDSVPVICLHAFNGKRQDFDGLAKYLQEKHGCAVIVPDLRGHGDSVDESKKLTATTMPLGQIGNMVKYDVEAVKAELIKRNNKGELNIDKLVVVGAEMGASVGMLWTVVDWSWPPLLTGKVGQDVKAVAMISPEFSYKGLNMATALAHPQVRSDVSIYVAAGNGDHKAVTDAKRVEQGFERFHRPPENPLDKDVFLDLSMNTKLQGTQLLGEPTLGLHQRIGQFIDVRSAKRPFPWAVRN